MFNVFKSNIVKDVLIHVSLEKNFVNFKTVISFSMNFKTFEISNVIILYFDKC